MASAVATDKLTSTLLIKAERFVGTAGTNAGIYHPIAHYKNILGIAALAVKTGNGMTLLELVVAESSSGTNATAIKTSGAIVADAVGTAGSVLPDQAVLELDVDEIATFGRTEGHTFTHVALRVTNHHASDVVIGTIILANGRFQYDGLTPATTIA